MANLIHKRETMMIYTVIGGVVGFLLSKLMKVDQGLPLIIIGSFAGLIVGYKKGVIVTYYQPTEEQIQAATRPDGTIDYSLLPM